MGRKIKDRYLGKVTRGSHVAGKGERDHLLKLIQNHRRAELFNDREGS